MGWRMGEGVDEWEGVRERDSGRVRASGTEGDGSERWKGRHERKGVNEGDRRVRRRGIGAVGGRDRHNGRERFSGRRKKDGHSRNRI